jgi:hypothetical protein
MLGTAENKVTELTDS